MRVLLSQIKIKSIVEEAEKALLFGQYKFRLRRGISILRKNNVVLVVVVVVVVVVAENISPLSCLSPILKMLYVSLGDKFFSSLLPLVPLLLASFFLQA